MRVNQRIAIAFCLTSMLLSCLVKATPETEDLQKFFVIATAQNSQSFNFDSNVLGLDSDALLTDLTTWRKFVREVDTHLVTPNVNGNGYVTVDINPVDSSFLSNNIDWVLHSERGALAEFSAENPSNGSVLSNSTITLGPRCIELDENGFTIDRESSGELRSCDYESFTEISAIFALNDNDSSDLKTVFDLDNVISGGIALWGFDDARNIAISTNKDAECAQLLRSGITLASTNRFDGCSVTPDDIVLPKALFVVALLLFSGLGLLGWQINKRYKV